MLHFELGGAGTGKSSALIKRIKQAQAENTAKIYVIVPDQYSFEYDKKLYTALGAERFNRITVLSFARLAQDVFLRFGQKGGEYADELTKIAVMYCAVGEIQKNAGLLYYDRQAKSPLFIDSALQLVKELRWSNISPETLAEHLKLLDGNVFEKMLDVSAVYTNYARLLEARGFKDSLGDIADAAQTAALNGAFCNTAFFVDGFQSFSGDELFMLDTILADAREVHLALTMDALPKGTKAASGLFSLTQDTYFALCALAKKHSRPVEYTLHETAHRFHAKELEFLSRNIFRPLRGQTDSCESITVAEAAEVYAEADYVCTEIRRLVREEGYRFSEMVVLSRNLSDYVSVLESAFARYDIPYFLDMNKPVMHKALILLVLSVLEASAGAPDSEAIFRYIKSGLLGIPYNKIAALENYCYKWNIDGEMWLSDFLEEGGVPDFLNALRREIMEPLMAFKEKTRRSTGEKICEALYQHFAAIGLDRNISGIAASQADSAENLLLAREHKQLWNSLIHILEVLHDTLGDTPISLKDFRDLLRLMLMESTFASAPQTLDSVMISAAERARLADPKVVFILGVNEGVFPYAVKSSGLFSDKDRVLLEKAGLKLSVTVKHQIHEERFVAYSALSAASERLYITYPLSDATGKVRFPSYILEPIHRMFPQLQTVRTAELPVLHFCSTEKAAYYNYVQNFKRNDTDTRSLRAFLSENPLYRDRLEGLERAQNAARQAINDTALTEKLFGKKMSLSASRFEDFNQCPFSYFCKKGLNLFVLRKVEFNPQEQGNAVHRCLYDVFRRYDKQSFLEQSRESLRESVLLSLEGYYTEVLGGDFGKSERFKKSYLKLADSVTELLLHMQEEFAQSGFVPADFELRISENGSVEPTKLITPSGLEISFIGTVDRVDTYEKDGKTYIRVVDYKTGSKLFRLEDVLYGINMQMLLYLFTLTENAKKYQNPEPAGVLYMPAGELEAGLSRRSGEEDCLRLKEKTFRMNGIVLDEAEIVEAMESDASGIYIPVKKSKEGFTKTSSLISKKQIENLKKHAHKLLVDMAERLHAGQIEALPLSNGKKLPCDYCDYWSICGNDRRKVRPYAPDSAERLAEILNGKEEKSER